MCSLRGTQDWKPTHILLAHSPENELHTRPPLGVAPCPLNEALRILRIPAIVAACLVELPGTAHLELKKSLRHFVCAALWLPHRIHLREAVCTPGVASFGSVNMQLRIRQDSQFQQALQALIEI